MQVGLFWNLSFFEVFIRFFWFFGGIKEVFLRILTIVKMGGLQLCVAGQALGTGH